MMKVEVPCNLHTHSPQKGSTSFLGELSPLSRIHQAGFGVSLRTLALPFTSSNFHLSLHLPLPCTSPSGSSPTCLGAPSPIFYSWSLQGHTWPPLSHLSCILNQIISPRDWKRSSSLLYSENKIKGDKKNYQGNSLALLSLPVYPKSHFHGLHGVHEYWSVGWLPLSPQWKLSFLGQPTTKSWLRRSGIGPRNLYFPGSLQVNRMFSQV